MWLFIILESYCSSKWIWVSVRWWWSTFEEVFFEDWYLFLYTITPKRWNFGHFLTLGRFHFNTWFIVIFCCIHFILIFCSTAHFDILGYRVQGSGVCYLQSTWVRSRLCTGCSSQRYELHRVQGSEVCNIQLRDQEYVTQRRQRPKVFNIQSAGARSVYYAEFSRQDSVTYKVQG